MLKKPYHRRLLPSEDVHLTTSDLRRLALELHLLTLRASVVCAPRKNEISNFQTFMRYTYKRLYPFELANMRREEEVWMRHLGLALCYRPFEPRVYYVRAFRNPRTGWILRSK